MEKLEIIIFDVEHGFCGFMKCPNGYSLMIDCGKKGDLSPVKFLKENATRYFPMKHEYHDLTKLLVSHPHGDHVEDVENLMEELPPAILLREPLSNFDETDIKHREREEDDENLKHYRLRLDEKYTTPVTDFPIWGVTKTYFGLTPEEARRIDPNKILNNTSKVLLVEFAGRKILFTGDLETAGWDALIKKNPDDFLSKVMGVDVFIAPHHGHKSGFSENLYKVMGKPYINIISKESESKGTSDVDSRYSHENYSRGVTFKNDTSPRRSLTTRTDGSIFISVDQSGMLHLNPQTIEPNLKSWITR